MINNIFSKYPPKEAMLLCYLISQSNSNGDVEKSLKLIAEDTDIPIQKLRTLLSKLIKNKAITKKTIKQKTSYKINNLKLEIEKPILIPIETPEKKEKEKKPNFIQSLIDLFCEVYLEERGDVYKISNKGAVNRAIASMLLHYKQLNPKSDSEQTLAGFKMLFIQSCNIKDEYLYKNLTIEFLNSQFPKYITVIKSSKNGKAKSKTSDQDIDYIIDSMQKQ